MILQSHYREYDLEWTGYDYSCSVNRGSVKEDTVLFPLIMASNLLWHYGWGVKWKQYGIIYRRTHAIYDLFKLSLNSPLPCDSINWVISNTPNSLCEKLKYAKRWVIRLYVTSKTRRRRFLYQFSTWKGSYVTSWRQF